MSLEDQIINALRDLSEATTEDIIKYLSLKKVDFTYEELRRVLIQMLKSGRIVKEPKPEKMKFVFKLSPHSSSRSYPKS